MAVERLKIRCYQCNQLLAVAPNKAGTVVACPKCKADLLIPRPEPAAKNDNGPGTDPDVDSSFSPQALTSMSLSTSSSSSSSSLSVESPEFLSDLAAVIPPEVAALRPEDLRVEAEFFENLTHGPPPASQTDPFRFPSSFDPEPRPSAPEEPSPAPWASAPGLVLAPEPIAATAAMPAPILVPPPLPAAEEKVVVPLIQLEPSTIPPPSTESRRIHEVTLPASVVLAWSLFVLASVALSFVAGLMIGHFLWRTVP